MDCRIVETKSTLENASNDLIASINTYVLLDMWWNIKNTFVDKANVAATAWLTYIK